MRKFYTLILSLLLFTGYSLAQDNAMVLVFNTNSSSGNDISLPLYGTVDVTVDWGDSSPTEAITTEGNHEHTYSTYGTYTVTITGSLTQFGNDNIGYTGADMLVKVTSFGTLGLTSLSGAFFDAVNLTEVPTSLPSSITDLNWTFCNASSFNQNISTWNVSNVTTMRSLFNTTPFNQDISNWNVSNVTNMYAMFAYNSSFNQPIGSWSVSNVENMAYMFTIAYAFDQDIGGWNVSSVTDMEDMFFDVTLSNINYNSLLEGWSQLDLQHGVNFNGGYSQYSLGAPVAARQKIIDDFNWAIQDGGIYYEPMVLVFDTNLSEETTISLPLHGTVNVTVDWGDDSPIETFNSEGNHEHTYATHGEYTVTISGNLSQFGYPYGYPGNEKLVKITSFGDLPLTSLNGAFHHAVNLVEVPATIPESVTSLSHTFSECASFNGDISNWDVSNVTEMYSTFAGASSFNGDIGSWNVGNVKSMSGMFRGAAAFNQEIGDWDVSNVTNMYNMFNNATSFNQNINDWDVSNVLDLRYMFQAATAFNQDLDNWDVSNVIYFEGIFSFATSFNGSLENWDLTSTTSLNHLFSEATSFNQDINSWDISNVTYIMGLFKKATAFNQDLSSWDVSNVTSMSGMFEGASSFNQDISGWDMASVKSTSSMFKDATDFDQDISEWDVSNVTSMESMFKNATSFNQDINGWDMSNTTSLGSMFEGASAFNQALNQWDVSNVTNMVNMFKGATSFNQDISGWNVGNVKGMFEMFDGASAFNQDLGNWNVSNVTAMNNMFRNATLSTANYNSILEKWSNQSLNHSITFDGGNSKYSPGAPADARQKLIDVFNWTIVDNGMSDLPAVTTTLPFSVTASTATTGGTINNNGGSAITDKGIVWGTNPAPTINHNLGKISHGVGQDNFTSQITDLTPETEYFVRAYAVNAEGTGYGPTASFTTLPEGGMELLFNTSLSSGTTIALPLWDEVDVTVYWGDGTSDSYTTEDDHLHSYATDGEYIVTIIGHLTQFGNGEVNYTGADKLVKVTSFGDLPLTSLSGAFREAKNLVEVPSQIPATVTNLSHTFFGCSSFNGNIGDWDVSNVTTMSYLFSMASSFNQDIGGWNVGKVTDMSYMFFSFMAESNFNQDIGNWDVSEVTDMTGMFAMASSFNQDIGNWNVGKVTSMEVMFPFTIAFNQDIGRWDVSNVTTMQGMFMYAASFDQNIGTWDVSNVTDMSSMFTDVALSTAHYNSLLEGWSGLESLQPNVTFSGGGSMYSAGAPEDGRQKLTDDLNWTITDGGLSSLPVVLTSPVTDITAHTAVSGGEVINNGGSSIVARGVVWGVSTKPTLNDNAGTTSNGSGMGEFTSSISNLHPATQYYVRAYATSANGTDYGPTHIIKTEPMPDALTLEFNTRLSPDLEISLPLFGDVDVTVYWGDGTSDSFTTEGVYSHIYATAGEYTVSISGSLTQFGRGIMGYPYAEKLVKVSSFGDLGLTSLYGAFYNAGNLVEVPALLPPGITSLNSAFEHCISFNGDISLWDVSSVTEMEGMFYDASLFNQDISGWDVSNVVDMGYTFGYARAFNQDISSWDVSKTESMAGMFRSASSFNQNIDSWDVGEATNMSYMFSEASSFNQDISSWDVSKVENMSYMFNKASTFNQDIGNWDVGEVINMNYMFYEASSFNQNIGGWDVKNAENMSYMFYGATLSTTNYNKLLEGWSTIEPLKYNVSFHGGKSKYSPGEPADAREHLITFYGWSITDGGLNNLPAIITAPITDITSTSATSGGEITSIGGSNLIVRGVVWSTNPEPNQDDYIGITTDGNSLGSFTSSITGLAPSTTYYVRAYAVNSSGTSYGPTLNFTTIANLTIGGSFTVKNKEFDGTVNAEINSNNLTLIGLKEGHNVTLTNVKVRFTQAEVGKNITVEIYEAELGGSDKHLYTLSLDNAPVTVANITDPVSAEYETLNAVKVYPNPFTSSIYFDALETIEKVSITTITGQQVLHKRMDGVSQLNVAHLPAGLYLVSIELRNGQRKIFRMVKQ